MNTSGKRSFRHVEVAILTLALVMACASLPAYAWNNRDNWFSLIPGGTSETRTKMLLFMIAATWSDRIKNDPDYHTDGTHNGNRPPTDGTANNHIGSHRQRRIELIQARPFGGRDL